MDSAENEQKNGNTGSEDLHGRADPRESATNQIGSEESSSDESTRVKNPRWIHDQDIGVQGLRDSLELIQGQVMEVVKEQQGILRKYQKAIRRFKR
jgi:hypothetical protein